MKARHIRKRTLVAMQHFLKRHWRLEKENWMFIIEKTEQQHGLGVTAFAEKLLQEHQLFSKRIEGSESLKIKGLEKLQNDIENHIKHILAGTEDQITISSNA